MATQRHNYVTQGAGRRIRARFCAKTAFLRWHDASEFAKRLGVSRLTVSELLHEKRSLSLKMAVRLCDATENDAGKLARMQTGSRLVGDQPAPEKLTSIQTNRQGQMMAA